MLTFFDKEGILPKLRMDMSLDDLWIILPQRTPSNTKFKDMYGILFAKSLWHCSSNKKEKTLKIELLGPSQDIALSLPNAKFAFKSVSLSSYLPLIS